MKWICLVFGIKSSTLSCVNLKRVHATPDRGTRLGVLRNSFALCETGLEFGCVSTVRRWARWCDIGEIHPFKCTTGPQKPNLTSELSSTQKHGFSRFLVCFGLILLSYGLNLVCKSKNLGSLLEFSDLPPVFTNQASLL